MTRSQTMSAIRDRLPQQVLRLGTDVIVALVWAALIVAIVLFSGTVSQFTYVDF